MDEEILETAKSICACGANSERAAALRRSARQLMAPYTEGGGFFFCAVKG